jgi:multiple sugar transport system permease protein
VTLSLPATNSTHRRRGRRTSFERLAPWILVAPAALLVLGLRVVPMVVAFALSFTDADLTRSEDTPLAGVGVNNYSKVLSSTDFHQAISTTAWIILPALAIEMVIGVAIALWLNRPSRLHGALQTVSLVPYLLVPVVIGNFFRMFYSAQFGQLNYYIGLLGFEPRAWLTDPGAVRWSVVAMEVWHTTPFVALLCLAGLKGLPRDPIEAALVLRAMDALQLFDEVYVLTGGGPGRLTSVINLYLYQFGFRQFQIGQTSAAVTVVVVFITVLGLLGAILLRQRARWLGTGEARNG